MGEKLKRFAGYIIAFWAIVLFAIGGVFPFFLDDGQREDGIYA